MATTKSTVQAGLKNVYAFGAGSAEGSGEQKNLLGGKGANLAEMARLGLPVPPGFTITTEVCTHYYANKHSYPSGLREEVAEGLAAVEKALGRKFGDPKNPLTVSVRSGARASMPGMMDTILNLGLNDNDGRGSGASLRKRPLRVGLYRRFVAMYGDVVLNLKPLDKRERDPFEVILEKKKIAYSVKLDTELSVEALKELVRDFKAEIKYKTGKMFPDDPLEQLWGAIGAVFGSWMNERAIVYRQLNGIPESWGTAVTVQSMVFGNLGDDCGTGVAFTRDPATGENVFYGEYLMNAQGEDVVAGVRTPLEIATLETKMPKVYAELLAIRKTLEDHYGDMQDIEFTVEKGKLWMLQTRTGKRTGFAEVRIAVEMVEEKRITPEKAVLRVNPDSLNQLLRPIFDPEAKAEALAAGRLLAKGLNAGPGAATGRVVFTAQDAFDVGQARRKGAPRARGDEPRGHQGHERVGGDPHGARRDDVARGSRRAADGKGLHRRVRNAAPRAPDGPDDRHPEDGRREDAPRGRLGVDRRDDGRGPRGPHRDEAVRGPPGPPRKVAGPLEERRLPALRDAHGVGRQGAPPQGARERGPARPGRERGRVRGRRDRPLPHGAHVLRR